MHLILTLLLTLFGALAEPAAAPAAAEDWPGWRGPTQNGISPLKNFPLTWSDTENVAWKAPLIGKGLSSPVISGHRVFLTADVIGAPVEGYVAPKHKAFGRPFRNPDSVPANNKHALHVLCFDTDSGKQLWDRVVYDGMMYDEVHKTSNYALATPATDGKFVYAGFGAEGFYKLDFAGNVVWKGDLGKIDTVGLGYGSSPVLFEDKLIALADQDDGDHSFIAALSTADGKVVWKTPRAVPGTFTTPVLIDIDGKKQLVVDAPTVLAYDPHDGKELWHSEGAPGVVVHTPVWGLGMFIASVGYPGKQVLGIRLNPAAGEERVAWKYTKGTSYVPSPLLYEDYLYLLTDAGLMTCMNPRTGEVLYEGKRFPTPGKFTSSMVAFDGKILVTSDDGDTYVVKAGLDHEILGKNSLNAPVQTSLALAGDSVYIRSEEALYRIRKAGK
jgi:outer membrane protein assembly factor BamB